MTPRQTHKEHTKEDIESPLGIFVWKRKHVSTFRRCSTLFCFCNLSPTLIRHQGKQDPLVKYESKWKLFKKEVLWFRPELVLSAAAIPVKPSPYVTEVLNTWRDKYGHGPKTFPKGYPLVYPTILPIHLTAQWLAQWKRTIATFCDESTRVEDQIPKIVGFWRDYVCRRKRECAPSLSRATPDGFKNMCQHKWHYVVGKWKGETVLIPPATSIRIGLNHAVPLLYCVGGPQ